MTCIFYCIVDIETQVAKLLMLLADWRASLWRLASRWRWNTSAKQLFDVRIKWGKSFSKHYSEVFRSFPEHGLITFFVRRVFVFWIILVIVVICFESLLWKLVLKHGITTTCPLQAFLDRNCTCSSLSTAVQFFLEEEDGILDRVHGRSIGAASNLRGTNAHS